MVALTKASVLQFIAVMTRSAIAEMLRGSQITSKSSKPEWAGRLNERRQHNRENSIESSGASAYY